jgi:hypothetical protein
LESVIAEFPQTAAAAKAKQDLGLEIYASATLAEEKRLERLAQASRVLSGIPSFSSEAESTLELLAALQAMLQQAGAEASTPALWCCSGLACQMVVDWDHPAALLRFAGNPLTDVARDWGFDYYLWTYASADEALLPMATSASRGRPVLLLWGEKPRWTIFAGYKADTQTAHLRLPGRDALSAVQQERFAAGWPTQVSNRGMSSLPPGGYQFALADRNAKPTADALVRGSLLQALLALDQPELRGAPAGRAAYALLAEELEAVAEGQDPQRLQVWAAQAVPLLARARRQAAAFLEEATPSFNDPQQALVSEAGRSYQSFALRWEEWNEQLQAAGAETSAEEWQDLAESYVRLADEETTILEVMVMKLAG